MSLSMSLMEKEAFMAFLRFAGAIPQPMYVLYHRLNKFVCVLCSTFRAPGGVGGHGSVLRERSETVVAHLAWRNLVGREHRVHRVTLAVDHAVRQAVFVELRGVGVRPQDLLAVGVPSAIRAVQRGKVGVGDDVHVSRPPG